MNFFVNDVLLLMINEEMIAKLTDNIANDTIIMEVNIWSIYMKHLRITRIYQLKS